MSNSAINFDNISGSKIPKSLVTTKGDIITATGNATPARQGVGNNGQIIVADDNLTNGLGYKDPAFRNWVMNGNFEVAQRGTSFTNPAHFVYVADRWKVMNNSEGATFPSSIVLTQEKLTSYYLRSSWNGELSNIQTYSRHGLLQYIEHGTKFLAGLNKKVTVTFYARSSIADKRLGVLIYQAYGTGGSPSSITVLTGNTFTLSSSWEKYSYTFATNTLSSTVFGTNDDNYLLLHFMYVWGSGYSSYMNTDTSESFVGSGNIDLTQVALYAGDVAYPFEPVPYDIELLRCMRYCQRFNYNEMRMRAYLISTNEIHFCYPISEMRIKPTASLIGTANTDYLVYATNGNPQSGFTFDINSYTNKKMCYIIATKNSHGLSDAFLMISTNGSALFDADF
ncbi:MAG TPA: hypothetical protein PLQ61_06900 [Bacteroidales bacterium]|nr:hypothetical protein [Petrotogaceae bacterium]HQJ20905.1 hypothetical protein [Bacteroidales bacterium]